jgi:hypothetical protein
MIRATLTSSTGKVGDTRYVENDTSDENGAYFSLLSTVQRCWGQTAPIFAFSLPCNSVLIQRRLDVNLTNSEDMADAFGGLFFDLIPEVISQEFHNKSNFLLA